MAPTRAFTFWPEGALIQKFEVAGHNIVLNFPDYEPYKEAPFFGETIGRVANRVKDGIIQDLNGKSYQLAQNNGPNHLHGGTKGWGKQKFSGPVTNTEAGKEVTKFTYQSPDGDEGYPGSVELRVTYTASEEEEDGIGKTVLVIEYEVEFTGDECEETAVNVTNHSYFTLSGKPTIEGTEVVLATVKHQVTDDLAIPTGEIKDFPGLEANKPFTLGAQEPDIDHCFILDPSKPEVPIDTRQEPLTKIVTMSHSNTGVRLDVFTTEPAFQYYTGSMIDVPATANTPARGPRSGICIEPSRYISAINVPEWRNQMLLKRGQTWGSKIVYKAYQY